MSFSEEHDHISRLCIFHAVSDRFFPVVNLDVFAVASRQTDFDIIVNITDFLIPWVIAGQHTEVCHLTCHLTHIISAEFGTVSTASVYTDQTFRMIFHQRGENTSRAHFVVRIVNDQRIILGYRKHLHSSFYLHFGKSL